jgi:hypothetical protein
VLTHGARTLPEVTVDSFSEELPEAQGFVGDRASVKALRHILDECRTSLRHHGHDPLGDAHTLELSKSKLDKILAGTDPLGAGLILDAIHEFGKELALVIKRFMAVPSWKGTERIVIGGGLVASHIGNLAIGSAAVRLAKDEVSVQLRALTHDPDEAGLIGAVHLLPGFVLDDYDALLAADIGGTNLRAGLLRLKMRKNGDPKIEVSKSLHWRHANDKPTREEAIKRMASMFQELAEHAKEEKLKLSSVVALACPGVMDERGVLKNGGQNLPGNWEEAGFNLTEALPEKIGKLNGHKPSVVMHNDAVVQGLAELPNMRDVARWGVLTIGTGLGNARFTNRKSAEEEQAEKLEEAKTPELCA